MTVHELLLERHSIRKYTEEPIPAEDVKTIIESGLLAPSSKSARSWQFVVVEDHDMLARLSDPQALVCGVYQGLSFCRSGNNRPHAERGVYRRCLCGCDSHAYSGLPTSV